MKRSARSLFYILHQPRSILLVISLWTISCQEESLAPSPTVPNVERTVAATTAVAGGACSTCTYVVPVSQSTIDGTALGIKAGDVICLNAAFKYGTLTFKNIVGTAVKPVVITNCGGTINLVVSGRPFNFKMSQSRYFRITGGNVAGQYGIRISGSTVNGMVLCELSTNFEVDHVEVSHVGFAGIMAKTDPTCDDATIRGNFTMRNISLHDNYVHDTGGEGFYIGHSFYDGYNTACGMRLPHTIEGSKIYNNLVRNSGWDGIQLSCATKNAAVYHNTVENYAVANKKDQMSGIILGAGTGGRCYGNLIKGGKGPGMSVFGLGDNVIHDNIIVDAGQMGIFCDERNTPGNGFSFINNTIINPKAEGIRLYAEKVPMNVVVNNLIINPGSYATYGENSYLLKLNSSVRVDLRNNYFTRSLSAVHFVNAGAGNYHLASNSPVINQGANIDVFAITQDFYRTARVKGAACDIGASEY